MKAVYVWLLLGIFLSIKAESPCQQKAIASSSDDCEHLSCNLDTSHCCFLNQRFKISGIQGEKKECVEITKGQYDNIKDYISLCKTLCLITAEECKINIDCKSAYLAFSLFSLIFIIL